MAIQSGTGPQRREESLAGRLSADDAVGAMWNGRVQQSDISRA